MEKLLDVREVTKLFGITRVTLNRWEKKGRFPKRIRLGGSKIVWKETDISNWIKNNGKIDIN